MKELEDYDWFPNLLRKFQMEYIGWTVKSFGIYRPMLKLIPRRAIFDLCSGNGDPIQYLMNHRPDLPKVTLSDKYPQIVQFKNESVRYLREEVDVLQMSFDSGLYYTMFNAFHHFTDKEQYQIITKLRASESDFCFCEILRPTLFSLITILLTTTIGQIMFTPFVKPLSFIRLLFTYLIPINVFTITYDGVISVFKSKRAEHYRELFAPLSISNYQIEVISLPSVLGNTLTIIKGSHQL